MNQTLSWLRKAGIAEGISFVLLLFIAMPLNIIIKTLWRQKQWGGCMAVYLLVFMGGLEIQQKKK